MKASIDRDILKLAIPSILANITVPLVGMVDIAVAGHIDADAAVMIGGIAIGSMLFDLLYWNFGFLRVGTGGLAAQAYGRGDRGACAGILLRAVGLAMAFSLVLLAVQWLFVKAAFLVVDCTPQVRGLASQYFFIRIWAAPATLSLMALKGWFIGMQDSVSTMVVDLVINGVNIVASILLALGFSVGDMTVAGIGFKGIAAGTVIAQWSGLLVSAAIAVLKYGRNTLAEFDREELDKAFDTKELRSFFMLNSDLFVRSLCFIAIYIGFTVISARYGDVLLAVCSIMMKILMIFSYFTDGFAYAGEALTGKYIGAKNWLMLSKTVKHTFAWSMAIAVVFMAVYHFAGVPLLRMMTSDAVVVSAAQMYLPWLLLMPVVGCAAFTWDGIYIGATASGAMRNSMLWAVVAFVVVWGAGILALRLFPDLSYQGNVVEGTTGYGIMAVHLLMAAYFAHLLARTIHLTVRYRYIIQETLQGI